MTGKYRRFCSIGNISMKEHLLDAFPSLWDNCYSWWILSIENNWKWSKGVYHIRTKSLMFHPSTYPLESLSCYPFLGWNVLLKFVHHSLLIMFGQALLLYIWLFQSCGLGMILYIWSLQLNSRSDEFKIDIPPYKHTACNIQHTSIQHTAYSIQHTNIKTLTVALL